MAWYKKIVSNGGMAHLPDCIDHYEKELIKARAELNVKGRKLENIHADLPGITETRYSQLQEIESILNFLNIELNKTRSQVFEKYRNAQHKAYSTRDAEKLVEGDRTYVNMAVLVNDFARIRNKYLGISKAIDQVSWQVGHINRLRCAGLDDARLD